MNRTFSYMLRLGTAALAIATITGIASGQGSRTMQVDRSGRVPLQGRQVREAGQKAEHSEAVRLEGEVSLSSRGLQVGRDLVRILPATTVLPRPKDLNRMPDLSRFRGQHATVFGRRGPDGIEATVIVFRSEDHRAGLRSMSPPLDQRHRRAVTGRTGSLSDDVPQ